MNLDVGIDQLVLEADADERDLRRVAPVVEEAVRLLAARLGGNAFDRPVSVAELRVGGLTADELLGPRGAERLADALYRALLRAESPPVATGGR